MGFRQGAYAKIWDVEKKDKYIEVRLSVSRKNKETGEYEDDFSGFARIVGSAKDKPIAKDDRIQIKECDVKTSYNAETKKNYTNFLIFDFEKAEPKAD